MTTFTTEIGFSVLSFNVEGFSDSNEDWEKLVRSPQYQNIKDACFDAAENVPDSQVVDELKTRMHSADIDHSSLTFSGVEYVECDSYNLSHANAYYAITVEGPDDIIQAAKREFAAEDDE